MLKKNKGKLILSSLVTLLPAVLGLLLWEQLPERVATHWGIDGTPDGWSGRWAIFVLPLVLLAAQWLCVLITLKDPKNEDQNPKAFALVIWIIPALSLLMMGFTYFVALGNPFSALKLMALVFGLMFTVIGNYMPKVRQNSTLGVKISWTLTSEANWNATHRFCGKVWTAGGVLTLVSIFLPDNWCVAVLPLLLIPMIALPVLYSWRYHRKELAEGTAPEQKTVDEFRKKHRAASGIITAVLLAVLVPVMFTGSIRLQLEDTALRVDATFWEELTLPYDAIDSLELREGKVDGVRTNGFNSAKLLLGTFQNEEFGLYTRYTYTDPESAIVIRSGERVLVISAEDAAATRALYEALLEKVG